MADGSWCVTWPRVLQLCLESGYGKLHTDGEGGGGGEVKGKKKRERRKERAKGNMRERNTVEKE